MKKSLLFAFTLFSLYSFGQDGVVDNSFGTSGKSYSGFIGDHGSWIPVVVQPDGKILQASTALVGGTNQSAVVRYNSNGGLDASFGNAGKFVAALDSINAPQGMALQNDGKIVLAGVIDSGAVSHAMVMRINSNGTLDASFGNNGRKIVAFSAQESAFLSVMIQQDGKIVVGGYVADATGSFANFGLARLNTNGTLDTSFDTDGKQSTPIGGFFDIITDMAIQSDGKIVVTGFSLNSSLGAEMAVARFTAAGALDNTFGTGGKFTTTIGGADTQSYSVAIQPDGKIVMSGSFDNGNNFDFALVRLTTAGVLDNTFGTGGKVTTVVGTDDDEAYSVAVQQDGKIVAGGDIFVPSQNGYDIAVLRYTSAGVLDNTFGSSGKTIVDMNSGSDDEYGMVVSQGTKIIVGVTHYDVSDNEIPSVVRINNSSAFHNPLACVAPATPTITISGNTLTSSASANNQWYLNGVAISGATNQTYVATATGSYTVIVTVSGCSSAVSNAISYTLTGLNSPALDVKVRMAPNPVSDKMVISYNGTGKLTVEVLDLSGRNVLNRKSFTASQELDFSGYASGTYIVRIINEKTNEKLQRLIVKQ